MYLNNGKCAVLAYSLDTLFIMICSWKTLNTSVTHMPQTYCAPRPKQWKLLLIIDFECRSNCRSYKSFYIPLWLATLSLMLTRFQFLYDFIREFLDAYLSINLHISGGQTGGRGCVTQVTLCVDGTYCLSVPTLVPQSGGVQCGHVPR
jgi:hypothetical protein